MDYLTSTLKNRIKYKELYVMSETIHQLGNWANGEIWILIYFSLFLLIQVLVLYRGHEGSTNKAYSCSNSKFHEY